MKLNEEKLTILEARIAYLRAHIASMVTGARGSDANGGSKYGARIILMQPLDGTHHISNWQHSAILMYIKRV